MLERLVTGSRFSQLRADYYRSRAALTLVAPISIIGQVLEIDGALIAWQAATNATELSDHARRWHDLSERLRIAGQTTVDAGMGRSYYEGEAPAS